MKTAIVLALLVSSCATTRAPASARAPVTRYVLAETLPPETEICVRQSAWLEQLVCWPLDELRHSMRATRRAARR